MNRKTSVYCLVLFLSIGMLFHIDVFAQQPAIEEDPEVQQILNRYISDQHSKDKVPGWRVLVLSTRDRRDMERNKRLFERHFRSLEPQWEYRDPNYRLYAGAFRDRLAVRPLLMKIKRKFPQAMEVKDMIPMEEFLNQYEIKSD